MVGGDHLGCLLPECRRDRVPNEERLRVPFGVEVAPLAYPLLVRLVWLDAYGPLAGGDVVVNLPVVVKHWERDVLDIHRLSLPERPTDAERVAPLRDRLAVLATQKRRAHATEHLRCLNGAPTV